MYKGDKCLAIGTKREIAQQLSMTEAAVAYCHTPSNARRNKGGNRKILILIDGEV